jgi:hypothetical protein
MEITYKSKLSKTLLAVRNTFVLGCIIFFVSCSTQQDRSPVIAKSGDVVLTKNSFKELHGEAFDPSNISHSTFVQRWVNEQALVRFAEESLQESDKTFDKEIKAYYNSLIKHAWEQKIIEKHLDTTISKEEVLDYYQNNTDNFELKQNIVRVRYVKVERNHKKLNQFKYLIQYKDSVQKEKFIELVDKHKVFTELKDSTWIPLEELKSFVPIKLYNDEHFLSNYRYTEAPDGEYVWIVFFVQHRLKDNVSPVNLVNDKIRNIILNKRKLAILQKFKEEAIEKAKKEGLIKINIESE